MVDLDFGVSVWLALVRIGWILKKKIYLFNILFYLSFVLVLRGLSFFIFWLDLTPGQDLDWGLLYV